MRAPRPGARRTLLTTAALAPLLLLAACGGGPSAPSPVPTVTHASPSATPTPTPSPSPSADPLAGWTLEQKVGQLLMVGVSVHSPQDASYDAVRTYHVGNVFLAGRTQAGTGPVRNLSDSFTALVGPDTTHDTPMLVATDQEGGQVQVLRGPGFSDIPSALDQSRVDPAALQDQATTWGSELAAGGVNLNLAPVMDLVAQDQAAANAPIGAFDRSYGFTAGSVTSHAEAFSAGMRASGVETVIKHFPGLGRVTQNTDTTAGVTDTVTTRDDPSVQVFADGIRAGARYVMMSTAVYTQIDGSAPAAFSPVVVGDVLRGDLGFDGVVMTDDVSAAEQVQRWSPGERAVLAVAAGVDVVLASADPGVVREMATALVARAQEDPGFAAQVDAAVLRVLAAKGA